MSDSILTAELTRNARLPRSIGWGMGVLVSLAMWVMILAAIGAL